MSYARAFGRFWYDFIVGEDWRIAAGVVAALAAGALLASADAIRDGLLVVLVAAAIVGVVVASVVGAAVSERRPK
jgi:uncharacterized membrane protein